MDTALRLAALLLVLTLPGLAAAPPLGAMQPEAAPRLWGVVLTTDGTRHTGYLRWDNGASAPGDRLSGRIVADPEWLDVLLEGEGVRVRRGERSVEFLGVRITWDDDRDLADWPLRALPLGKVEAIRRVGDAEWAVHLAGGEVATVLGSLGSVEVTGERGERLTIEPDVQQAIEVDAPPAGWPPPALRLHAEVEDRWGGRWRGALTWGGGVALESDTLVLRNAAGDAVAVPAGQVDTIEPGLAGGGDVTTAAGERATLEQNPGDDVRVVDPRVGVVTLPAKDVRRIRILAAPLPPVLPGGVGGVVGTVRTRDGQTITGDVRWGEGLVSRWHHLRGRRRSVHFDVPLAAVARIEPTSPGSARLHLVDGRTLEVRGGDVGREVPWIAVIVAPDHVEWIERRDVAEVTFARDETGGAADGR